MARPTEQNTASVDWSAGRGRRNAKNSCIWYSCTRNWAGNFYWEVTKLWEQLIIQSRVSIRIAHSSVHCLVTSSNVSPPRRLVRLKLDRDDCTVALAGSAKSTRPFGSFNEQSTESRRNCRVGSLGCDPTRVYDSYGRAGIHGWSGWQ